MAGSTARIAAIETLFQLEKTRKPVSVLFDQIADQYRAQGNDRQLAMKIIYGVLRNRHYLDRLLGILCSRPVNKIKPYIRHALHCGLYQVFFLDRIPHAAAINETVNVVKSRNFPSQLQGFVNGVLRQSVRKKDGLPLPDDPDERGQPVLNHPDWLIKRWQRCFGKEVMTGICLHNNREPVLSLRLASADEKQKFCRYLSEKSIPFENGHYAPNSLLVSELNVPVKEIAEIREGVIHVQDQAAQLATLLLAPFDDNLSFLDGCAGLGGKTSHIAEIYVYGNIHISAVEPDRRRCRKLEKTLNTLPKHVKFELFEKNLQEFSSASGKRFDRILIDAPCSGTGVIGRHPDIRWNRREKDLAEYQARQLELLSAAAAMARPDGIIVYSTCSIEPEENDSVIGQFLKQHTNFFLSDGSDYLPDSCRKFIRNGCFSPLPEYGIDGFFAARLVKRGKDD